MPKSFKQFLCDTDFESRNEFTLLLSKVSRKKKTCNNIKYFPYLELATSPVGGQFDFS